MNSQNPLWILFEARNRRTRKWARPCGVAFGLLDALCVGISGLPLSSPRLVGVAMATFLGLYAICQVGFACWSCSSTTVSLVAGGGYRDLTLAGIGPHRVLDSGARYFAGRWLNFTPLFGLAALLLGNPAWSLLCLGVWGAILPVGICSTYCQNIIHLSFAGLLPLRKLMAWGAISYLSGSFGVLGVCGAALSCDSCPVLIGLSALGSLIFMLAWCFFFTGYARKLAAESLEQSVGRVSPLQIDRGRPGWWDHSTSSNPLVFRYLRTRPRWRGLPAWLWVAAAVSLFGTVASLVEPGAGLAVVFYTLFLHGVVSCLAHINFLYQENLKKNMDSLIGAMDIRELVDGLAQIAYVPRIKELLLATLPVLAMEAIPRDQVYWLLFLAVFLTAPMLMAMHWLSSHVNVWFALTVYRRSLPPMLVCLAPVCTYFLLFGLLLASSLLGLGTSALLLGGLTFIGSIAVAGACFRHLSLKTVRS